MLNLNELEPGKYYWVRRKGGNDETLAVVYGKSPSLHCRVLDPMVFLQDFSDYHWLAEFDMEGARQVLGPQHATGIGG